MGEPKEAFLEAAKKGEVGTVRGLLEKDPGLVNSRDAQGVSAILLSRYCGQGEILRLLLGAAPHLTIHEAAAVGELERSRDLAGRGPDVIDSYSADGFTALGLAAHFGHEHVVKFLLGRGADPNTISDNPMRFTALTGAVAGGHHAVARMLLDNGADANYTYVGGLTPLGEAAAQGDAEMVRLLLSRGARVNTRTDEGKTPLALALAKGHGEAAEVIRDNGGQL